MLIMFTFFLSCLIVYGNPDSVSSPPCLNTSVIGESWTFAGCYSQDFFAGTVSKVPQAGAGDGDPVCVFYAVEQVSDQKH